MRSYSDIVASRAVSTTIVVATMIMFASRPVLAQQPPDAALVSRTDAQPATATPAHSRQMGHAQ